MQRGVEQLLGRVPGLHQVVVEAGGIDGADGGLGIGVGGEQHPFSIREKLAGVSQQLHALHFGHALVGQHQRQRLFAAAQLTQRRKRLRA